MYTTVYGLHVNSTIKKKILALNWAYVGLVLGNNF